MIVINYGNVDWMNCVDFDRNFEQSVCALFDTVSQPREIFCIFNITNAALPNLFPYTMDSII